MAEKHWRFAKEFRFVAESTQEIADWAQAHVDAARDHEVEIQFGATPLKGPDEEVDCPHFDILVTAGPKGSHWFDKIHVPMSLGCRSSMIAESREVKGTPHVRVAREWILSEEVLTAVAGEDHKRPFGFAAPDSGPSGQDGVD